MKTVMSWKGDVGKGWHPIVEEAINKVESKGGFIRQVKEKFGGLRIYYIGGDCDAIDDIIREAERKCGITCEECGSPGSLSNENAWLKTLCPNCQEKAKH